MHVRGDVFWFIAAVGTCAVASCTNDFDKFNFREPSAGGATAVATAVSVGGGAGMASSSTGMPPECSTPQDCGTSTQCLQKNCKLPEGICVDFFANIGASCTEGGPTWVCDGQGQCVECVDGMQCVSMVCDMVNHVCLAAGCGDMVVNGDETDVDCGGSCADCVNNKNCNAATDCVSGFCDMSLGPCSGGGGAGGGPMVSGCCQPCGTDVDCTGSTWCDNGVCVPKKPDGDPCGGGNECTSTFCADSFCCNSACSLLCAACSNALTGQANGTCAGVTVGTDPGMECAATPANCRTGDCSGTPGQCQLVPPTTACNDGMFCTTTDACDSLGVCVGTGNPCPGHNGPISCDDSCDEALDNCLAKDAMGSTCDENMNTVFGTCDGAGVCLND